MSVRNSLCHCGSGKKTKYCHGKKKQAVPVVKRKAEDVLSSLQGRVVLGASRVHDSVDIAVGEVTTIPVDERGTLLDWCTEKKVSLPDLEIAAKELEDIWIGKGMSVDDVCSLLNHVGAVQGRWTMLIPGAKINRTKLSDEMKRRLSDSNDPRGDLLVPENIDDEVFLLNLRPAAFVEDYGGPAGGGITGNERQGDLTKKLMEHWRGDDFLPKWDGEEKASEPPAVVVPASAP